MEPRKAKRRRCPGCGQKFMAVSKVICEACRSDPELFVKAKGRQKNMLEEKHIILDAKRAAKRLPEVVTLTYLERERIVEGWGR